MDDPSEPLSAEPALQLANEFATVEVRKVLTPNGERLEIRSPRLGHMIRLDPLELESLSWQTHESLSRLLAEPYGPDRPRS
jgi:hypothetical protein